MRYGNVLGSNGSVVPFFLEMAPSGVLPITDERMTRFNITLNEGVEMVLHALNHAWGGEIFVPKIPSYRITDLANVISKSAKKLNVGIRPGEKIHEEMISVSDSFTTYDLGKYYVILPQKPIFDLNKFIEFFGAVPVEQNFSYNSGDNELFETEESLIKLIKENIDINFQQIN